MEGRRLRATVGMCVGGAFGLLTLLLLAIEPGSSSPIVAAGLRRLLVFVYPGLFIAMAAGGSVFSAPLWLWAISNAGIYFVAGWFLCALWETHFRGSSGSDGGDQ
jgi:hypothetical protein